MSEKTFYDLLLHLLQERKQLMDQLTETQKRCNELREENIRLKKEAEA